MWPRKSCRAAQAWRRTASEGLHPSPSLGLQAVRKKPRVAKLRGGSDIWGSNADATCRPCALFLDLVLRGLHARRHGVVEGKGADRKGCPTWVSPACGVLGGCTWGLPKFGLQQERVERRAIVQLHVRVVVFTGAVRRCCVREGRCGRSVNMESWHSDRTGSSWTGGWDPPHLGTGPTLSKSLLENRSLPNKHVNDLKSSGWAACQISTKLFQETIATPASRI